MISMKFVTPEFADYNPGYLCILRNMRILAFLLVSILQHFFSGIV